MVSLLRVRDKQAAHRGDINYFIQKSIHEVDRTVPDRNIRLDPVIDRAALQMVLGLLVRPEKSAPA